MIVPNESKLSSSTSISERTKRRVVLHIVRYFLEMTKKFSEEDRRDIICRVLHHQHLNDDMDSIKFRDQCVLEEIVKSMKSSLDLVKGVESIDKLVANRATFHMVFHFFISIHIPYFFVLSEHIQMFGIY